MEMDYNIYAFCLMTNHVHLFIKEKHASDIMKIMSKILTQYAGWFNREYLRNGTLFGDRYRSEAIEDEKYLFSLVRYIHQNPVQAGMVIDLKDYKWSSFKDYIRPDSNSLVDTSFILSQFSNKKDKSIELFTEFNYRMDNENFEIATGRRMSEISIKRKIMSVINEEHPHIIKSMQKHERDLIIYKLYKNEGLSKSVIKRATSISRGTIIRIIKQYENS